MRRSPFVPFLFYWAVLAAAGFLALGRALPLFKGEIEEGVLGSLDLWRAIAALNTATFLLYGTDKLAAIAGGARVPERLLFLTALFGSPAGGLAGMFVFRHKVSKTSFLFVFAVILLVQVALAAWWFREK